MTNMEQGPRPQGRKERAAWYAKALEDQAASGVSVATYAARIGVTAVTLYQWRRRLNGPAGGPGETDTARPSGLIEVAIKNCPSASSPEKFLVRLGPNRSIEVPQDFNPAALEQLLGLLEAC